MIVRKARPNNDNSPLHRALKIAALEAALADEAQSAEPRVVRVVQAGAWSFADEDGAPVDPDRPLRGVPRPSAPAASDYGSSAGVVPS